MRGGAASELRGQSRGQHNRHPRAAALARERSTGRHGRAVGMGRAIRDRIEHRLRGASANGFCFLFGENLPMKISKNPSDCAQRNTQLPGLESMPIIGQRGTGERVIQNTGVTKRLKNRRNCLRETKFTAARSCNATASAVPQRTQNERALAQKSRQSLKSPSSPNV